MPSETAIASVITTEFFEGLDRMVSDPISKPDRMPEVGEYPTGERASGFFASTSAMQWLLKY